MYTIQVDLHRLPYGFQWTTPFATKDSKQSLQLIHPLFASKAKAWPCVVWWKTDAFEIQGPIFA